MKEDFAYGRIGSVYPRQATLALEFRFQSFLLPLGERPGEAAIFPALDVLVRGVFRPWKGAQQA